MKRTKKNRFLYLMNNIRKVFDYYRKYKNLKKKNKRYSRTINKLTKELDEIKANVDYLFDQNEMLKKRLRLKVRKEERLGE